MPKIKNGDLIQVLVWPLGYCLVRVSMVDGHMGHVESTETRMVPYAYRHTRAWHYEPMTAIMEEKC